MRLAIVALCAWVTVAAAEPRRVVVSGDDAAVVAGVRDGLRGKIVAVTLDDTYDALVTVAVGPGRKATATIVVYDGRGTELGRLVLREKRGKLAAAVKRAAWKKLGRAIDKAEVVLSAGPDRPGVGLDAPPPEAPPPPPPPSPPAPAARTTTSPPAPDATAEARATVSPRRGPPRVRITVDERPFWRRLRYNDDYRRVTRPYDLAANAVGLELGVRPFASQPRIELVATGLVAVGVKGSRTRDGTGYPTKASEWSIGAGYGGTLGPARLAVRLGYGEHRFHVEDDPAMGAELLPDVTYRWGRAGLDAAIAVTPRWRVIAGAGGRYLVGTGDLTGADWFPRATGRGVDGALGVAWRVARRLSLHARAEVRHYFFAMNPEIGDPMIVGGAIDTYLGGAVGASVELW